MTDPTSSDVLGAQDLGRITLPLKLARRDVEARFANHVEVSYMGDNFILRLAQFDPPTLTDASERDALLAGGGIEAPVIAKFVVPTTQFVAMVESLSALVARLKQRGLIQEEPNEEG